MLDNFDKKYSALAKSYKGKRSMAEIMTIASMIEREAKADMSERPMIAGVIENRLAAKMQTSDRSDRFVYHNKWII